MKTYEEMAQSALDRIADYKAKQQKRKKTVLKITVPAISFCVIAAVCIGVWHNGLQKNNAPLADPDKTSNNYSSQDKAASDDTSAQNDEQGQTQNSSQEKDSDQKVISAERKGGYDTEEAVCHFWWKNKLVMGGDLYFALQNNPTGSFSVIATYRPATADITSFTYEGKTLSEWAIAAEDEKILPEKMAELLKLGDELKYGTALYETGTPDGIKWDRSFYEQKVEYFGKLLDKYIVNGRFLKSQLEQDLAALSQIDVSSPDGTTSKIYTGEMEKKYKQAYNAYLETVMPAAVKQLTKSGISCERDTLNSNSLALFVTAEQLENLPLDDLKSWYFCLKRENTKGVSDEETYAAKQKVCY